MAMIGAHKLVLRDILARLAPVIVCSMTTYSLSERLDVDDPGVVTAIFLLVLAPAILMWYFRMKRHPDDPWRFGTKPD
jgi:hypothetical protein